jgi:succinate dehydrogenase/fumarate reductase flavoprotein subunit
MVDYYTDVTPAMPRMHLVASNHGSGYTTVLYDKAVSQGAEFIFNTQATKLVANENGDIVGVIGKNQGEEVKVKAQLGVILNTAGFSRNPDMVRGFMTPAIPNMTNEFPVLTSYGSPWQKGDGIMMAAAAGARLTNTWVAYNMAPAIPLDPEDNSGGFIVATPLYVSTDGKAHVSYTPRPSECVMGDIWKQPDGYVYGIWDQALLTHPMPFAGAAITVDDMIASGYVTAADTVADLARIMNVDAAVLEATINEHNATIGESGALDGMGAPMQPLAPPPYYVAKVTATSPDTAGGVAVNDRTEVISNTGEIIPRLYAVGSMCGGWKGKINSGCGQALGWTFTSGRVAAEQVLSLQPIE